jgi:hypothetical protein
MPSGPSSGRAGQARMPSSGRHRKRRLTRFVTAMKQNYGAGVNGAESRE